MSKLHLEDISNPELKKKIMEEKERMRRRVKSALRKVTIGDLIRPLNLQKNVVRPAKYAVKQAVYELDMGTRVRWAFHNGVAHPLMVILPRSLAEVIHDRTVPEN